MKIKNWLLIPLIFSFLHLQAQPPFWKLNGNPATGPDLVNTTNNFFGTSAPNNVPVRFGTNGINRMKLNNTVSYNVNSGAGARDGFLLVGGDNNTSFGTLYGAANGGAFSLLHLNGINANGFAQEGGYRSWMRFGITSTHNQDLMWMGQRSTGGADITDAMLCWADNSTGGAAGPDNMLFTFLAGPDGVSEL